MKTPLKLLIVAGLAVAVAAAVALKRGKTAEEPNSSTGGNAVRLSQPRLGVALPRLVDLGAGLCTPCRKMVPVLEELKRECSGRMEVEFIDVRKNPDAIKAYKVEVIPTQIFYDAKGKELFRHAGFFGKADILVKWKELAVNLADSGK